MLKGLIICFTVLFAQLAVLNVIDARLYNAQDARQAATMQHLSHKEEDDDNVSPPAVKL
ncbi:hypothetical protein [Vreelandella venusta]|uniref:Uncharacterized protein n=1 Tax=Vreelandella venusta TaxID=44935 RepID=A0AAP9ZFT3_9GAMM|nr:hypothetical protein [Halomonas venusta]MDW0357838.1 hypothetical protein [Halomonas venusta]QPI65987.1 hypothetical protein IR195_09940 [Halomonas venusta]QRL05023.1 hypothetical protein JDS37_08865 [Halomonas venusta]GEK52702.1 hypothetical protein HVE01_34230 [Halomonas venusta]